MARSALRLLALLGFACVAVILCSTSANADSGNAGGHDAAPASKPGLVPGLLKAANNVLQPVVAPARRTDTDAGAVGATSPGATDSSAVSPVAATAATGPSSAGTPDGTPPVALPRHHLLTPVVGAATQAVTATVDVASGTTSSNPALGLAATLLRTVGTVTTQVTSGVGALTTRADTGLVSVVAATGSLLTPLTGGDRQLASAGSSSSTAAGMSFGPPTVVAASGLTAIGVLGGLRELARAAQSTFAGSGAGALWAPPRPAASTVRTVPAVVASAAPALGAVGAALGFAPGTAAGGSSGLHDQTEVPRGFDFRTVMAIGPACAPAVRPLPGTPLVDPGFSPD